MGKVRHIHPELESDGSAVVRFRASRVRGLVFNLLTVGLGVAVGMAVVEWQPRLAEAADEVVTVAVVLAALHVLVTVFLVVFNRGDLDHEKEISFDGHGVRCQWFWSQKEIPWGELREFRVSRTPPGSLRLIRRGGRDVRIENYYAFSEEQRHKITACLERGMRAWRIQAGDNF